MVARRVSGRKGWYIDRWIDIPGQSPQRLRKKSPYATKKETEAWERQVVADVLSSINRPPTRRFDEFSIEYLERHGRVHLKPSTFSSYESALAVHLLPFFGHLALDEITAARIAEFQALLWDSGKSNKTIRNIVGVLASVLRTAEKWELLESVPKISYPKLIPPKFRFLSVEDCEKVMAASVNEARAMITAAEENGVRLMIGHNTRYFPAFAQARRLIEAGEIGEVVAIDGAFPNRASLPDTVRPTFWGIKAGARGHGIVMNFGCHYVDTARFLCGEAFTRVSAHIGNRFSEDRAPEDQYVITAITDSQTVVTIAHYGQHAPVRSRNTGFTIYGTHGILEAFYFPDAVAIRRADADDYREVDIDADLKSEGTWERLHRELREAIENGVEPSVTGTDGLRNIEWALGAYLSHQKGSWVELPLAPEHWDYCGPTMHESLPMARDWDAEV